MSIFIIGSHGFIAQKLIEDLSKIETEIITTSSRNNDKDLYLNLTEPDTFDYSIIKKNDFILLLAAISSPDVCNQQYDFAYSINVTGTIKFIEKCLSQKARVLFFSSDIVYGQHENIVNENSECLPLGNYAEMKLAVERKFYAEKNFKIFRLSFVFSKSDKYSSYLANCSKKSMTAEVFHPIFRRTVYIEDLKHAIISLHFGWNDWDNTSFNISGPDLISRVDVANYYKEIVDIAFQYEVIEPNEEFYRARPQIINMDSIYFAKLLKRTPLSIREAMNIEFKGE